MLNGTLCAAQRTLTCILENYQEKEGVRVPPVLVKTKKDIRMICLNNDFFSS